MALFVAALVVAFGLRKLLPRRFLKPATVRWLVLPAFAAALQLALGTPPLRHVGDNMRFAVVVGSYAIIGTWIVMNTVRQPQGLRRCGVLVSIGWLLNVIAIVANRGMPVSQWALAQIGARHPSVADGNLFKHVLATTHTVVLWLGDVIPIAVPVLRNVISIGDILVMLAVVLAVQRIDFAQSSWSSKSRAASCDTLVQMHNVA